MSGTARAQLMAELTQWHRTVPDGDWRCYITKDECQLLLIMHAQLRACEVRSAADTATQRAVRRNEPKRSKRQLEVCE